MGTAMRFITALGGVVLIAFALGLFGYPIIETIADPEHADFPGGAAGIVVMLLLMAYPAAMALEHVGITGGDGRERRAGRWFRCGLRHGWLCSGSFQ
jgi:hypothetical protein